MRIPSRRLQQLDDEAHDRAGRVELAALLAGVVGELTDEVLVGVAQDVDGALLALLGEIGIAQVKGVEVAQQAADDAVAAAGGAELRLIVPVGVVQDAVEAGGVRLLDLGAGAVDHLAQVHRLAHDGAPAGLGRNEELVLVGVTIGDPAGNAGGDGVCHLLGEAVGEALQEEHREDVVLVVAGVDLATEDVGRAPQLGPELAGRKGHRQLLPPSGAATAAIVAYRRTSCLTHTASRAASREAFVASIRSARRCSSLAGGTTTSPSALVDTQGRQGAHAQP